ncbi:hypothetical protein KCP77_22980 [Salmonella enterica subsp. enterica]|nr:hypothetical protein KCP77_22980 [Salmonella enterica subsp. enterica]
MLTGACRPPAIHLVTAMPVAHSIRQIVQRHGNGFPAGAFSPMPSPPHTSHIFQFADVCAINMLIEDLQQTRFEDKRGRVFRYSVRKTVRSAPLFTAAAVLGIRQVDLNRDAPQNVVRKVLLISLRSSQIPNVRKPDAPSGTSRLPDNFTTIGRVKGFSLRPALSRWTSSEITCR